MYDNAYGRLADSTMYDNAYGRLADSTMYDNAYGRLADSTMYDNAYGRLADSTMYDSEGVLWIPNICSHESEWGVGGGGGGGGGYRVEPSPLSCFADLFSVGCRPKEIDHDSKWQNGPMFLKHPREEWPVSNGTLCSIGTSRTQ